jgi:methylmalonyl-CoA mutase
MAIASTPSLGADDPTPTLDDWRRLVDEVLAKSSRRDLTTVLDAGTDGAGIELQPLYTRADVVPALLAAAGVPGAAPFLRGSTALGGVPTPSGAGWEVRQRVHVDDSSPTEVRRTNERILAELERGATGLILGLTEVEHIDVDLLDRILEGVYLELVPVSLQGGPRSAAAGRALIELWQRRGTGAEARGTISCDPVAVLARRGGPPEFLENSWYYTVDIAKQCAAEFPLVRSFLADATPYHDAGATDAQELGCALGTGVVAVRTLTERGLSVDDAFRQIELRIAATADQFSTIAKVRALRVLWDRVGEIAGASPEARAPRIHAMTSVVMLTRYDPWVNLLRNTVACFAAGVGGADAVTVRPHDVRLPGLSSEFAQRMARNTQAVLLDESNLGRVLDPAGGSWYVESLTEELADRAWGCFQRIEEGGGMVQTLVDGRLHQILAGMWERRLERIAHRTEPVTGISEFPDVDEPHPDVPPPAAAVTDVPAGEVAPLPRIYAAMEFEALRDAVAEHERAHGVRPLVVLVGIGTPADHNARSTFAKNLYEAGGLRTVLVEGDDPVRLAADAAATGCALACLCSSDARYPDTVPAVAAALRGAGVEHVQLAGKARDHAEAWAAAGVGGYIAAGCDAIGVLSEAHELIGITSISTSTGSTGGEAMS